jgi:hypothetical protein
VARRLIWKIDLHYLPWGGLDFELSEGWFTQMEEWGLTAARYFKGRLGPVAEDDCFSALVRPSWKGWDEDAEMTLKLVGPLEMSTFNTLSFPS